MRKAIRTKKEVNSSKRDTILNRTFKMATNCGLYSDEQYHDYCVWAKGKSESMLVTELNLVRALSL